MPNVDPIVSLALCEASRIVLRPGVTYRFLKMEGCEACARDAAAYANDPHVPEHCKDCGGDVRLGTHGIGKCWQTREV